MHLELPFFHRFLGRTPRDEQKRWLVAQDRVTVEIPENHLAGYDSGSTLKRGRSGTSDVVTLEKDGMHWASCGLSGASLGYRSKSVPVDKLSPGVLFSLMWELNTSMFFENGRCPVQSRLKSTPKPEFIEHSERDGIVERLTAWSQANLAVISGVLHVRVHEPSLVLRISQTELPPRSQTAIRCEPALLTMWGSDSFSPGLHFTFEEADYMVDLAREKRDIGPLWKSDYDPILYVESSESMAERSVLSMASYATKTLNARSRNVPEIRAALGAMSKIDPTDRPDSLYDELWQLMGKARLNLVGNDRLTAHLVDDSWMNRSITAPLLMGALTP